jgi:8-oxo-dGTP diphosphatase
MPATAPEPSAFETGCLGLRDGPAKPLPLVLVSAVALVDLDGRVLLAQRPEGKPMANLWEFPGGKLADGESPEAAAVRELREELGIDITESCLAPLTFASFAYPDFRLLMPLFVCRVWRGTPVPREHRALQWLRPLDMTRVPMPPADRPLVAMLRDFL